MPQLLRNPSPQVAKILTDIIVFNFLPNGQSVVLRNKRLELVSKKSEFAEIGLKAALAAATYRSFDPDNNGSIEPEDIVRIFAHVDGVPWEKAHAIGERFRIRPRRRRPSTACDTSG